MVHMQNSLPYEKPWWYPGVAATSFCLILMSCYLKELEQQHCSGSVNGEHRVHDRNTKAVVSAERQQFSVSSPHAE